MEINVFKTDLEFVGIIDDFLSFRWRRKYFEAGEFELHLAFDPKLSKFLYEDFIIMRDDSLEAGIIEVIEYVDQKKYTEVIIIGRFLSSILDRRIVRKRINFSGNYLNGERKILTEMTPFSMLEIKNADLVSDSVTFQCTYKCVYDYLIKLAKSSGIAHRIVVDLENKKFIYENYQGLDRTASQNFNEKYEFSEDNENLSKATFIFNSKTKKNYALIGGAGEGADRVLAEIKDNSLKDFELREVFVDARGESNDEISSSEYNKILKEKGKEKICDSTETLEVQVLSRDYKIKWDLGDIVDVKKESWDKNLRKRIVEIEEIFENSKHSIYATLGDPVKETFKNDEE